MHIRISSRIAWALLALACLACASIVYAAYRRDLDIARTRVATGSLIAQTRCGPIEYAVSGTGPPVLVVHGAGGGFDQGLDIGASLVARGLRVIAMSRFGYLRTPLPADASATAQADAHACLLDALKIPRAAIVGVSAGAPSATLFALRHPERCSALVLLSPAMFVPRANGAPAVKTPSGTAFLFDTALRSDFIFWLAERVGRRAVIHSLLGTPPELVDHASSADLDKVNTVIAHLLPVTARREGLINDGRVVSALDRYPLEQIHTPTLALSAADDLYKTYDGAQYTAAHVAGARFLGYPTGGHLWVGHSDEVADAVAGFVVAHP
jgi:pimeloyl-ACP methyl ester carboxylesterase